jgi:allantoin racemase
MRIVVINPNTSGPITDTITTAARSVADRLGDVSIIGVNPSFGVASVESHLEEAWATIGILQVIEADLLETSRADAFVIACFGDTGLDAAREAASVPVVGMSEAALYAAASLAHRFSIVTMPTRTIAQSERVVERTGLRHRCNVRAVGLPVASLEHDAASQLGLFLDEANKAIAEDGAEAIILGCAGLAELVEPMQESLGMPVIDGVAAGVTLAAGLVAQRLATSRASSYGTVNGAPSAIEFVQSQEVTR